MNVFARSFRGIVLPAAVLAIVLVAGGTAGPALAGGGGTYNPPPPPSGSGQTGTGSSSGGSYTATVAANIVLGGDYSSSGYDETWTPPDCWLQPEFHQPQTYRAGDPANGPIDAFGKYWQFGTTYPGFAQLIHGTGGLPYIAQDFQDEQKLKAPPAWTGPQPIEKSYVWWAPNWLNTQAGLACAQALVATANLSDAYVGMERPAPAGSGGGQGQITSLELAALARAALNLPKVDVVTSPPATKPATVNVPAYVSVNYDGVTTATDSATVEFPGGAQYLRATVHAYDPQVTFSASGGAYTTTGQGGSCAAVNGRATAACTITFRAPSGNAPYGITVNVTWKVEWQTSANPGVWTQFPDSPPQTGTSTLAVQEIQTQT